MWLEDDEIRQHLRSGRADEVGEAFAAIDMRLQGGDDIGIEPLRANVLNAYGDQIPREILKQLVDWLLWTDGIPALPPVEAFTEIAKLVVNYADTSGEFDIAMRLKIDDDPVNAVRDTLHAVGEILMDEVMQRISDIGYFMSSLLDGAPPIRQAAVEALAAWPSTPIHRKVIDEIRAELTDAELALIDSPK
jgi:hypothetical protein